MTVRTVTPAGGAVSAAFTWDGGVANLAAGTVLDVPPGSALETAIGSANLAPLTGQALTDAANGGGSGGGCRTSRILTGQNLTRR